MEKFKWFKKGKRIEAKHKLGYPLNVHTYSHLRLNSDLTRDMMFYNNF